MIGLALSQLGSAYAPARPLAARCHLGLGQLYRRAGKPERAREHLEIAGTMRREMDMPHWLTQAEAELRKLG